MNEWTIEKFDSEMKRMFRMAGSASGTCCGAKCTMCCFCIENECINIKSNLATILECIKKWSATHSEISDKEKRLLNVMAENGYPWVATDKNGKSYFFRSKPTKSSTAYIRDERHIWSPINNHICTSWDSEPYYTEPPKNED